MGWQTKKLSEVLDIQNGFAFDSKRFSSEDGMPLIRIRDISNGFKTVTNYLGEYKSTYVVESGDFLIGMDGEFRCYEWKGESALLNQRVCRLKDFSNELYDRFLFYGINKYLKDIEDVTSFTTVKHISAKQIKNIEFPLPPIPEQQRIVAILDQAFADIEKARANAERNLKNARELFDSYLNQASADKKPLGKYVTIKTGKLNSNAATEDGAYPFFTCSRDVFSIDSYSFDCEAILLAGNNASGDFNVKHFCGKFDAYQRTYVITINEVDHLLYSYLYFQMMKSLRQLKNSSVGAGTKFLKIGMIQNLEISIPSISEQQRILDVLEPLKESIEQLEETYKTKAASLDELKKSLLQKAFSGELTKGEGKAA